MILLIFLQTQSGSGISIREVGKGAVCLPPATFCGIKKHTFSGIDELILPQNYKNRGVEEYFQAKKETTVFRKKTDCAPPENAAAI